MEPSAAALAGPLLAAGTGWARAMSLAFLLLLALSCAAVVLRQARAAPAGSPMTFLGHVEELRRRLLTSAFALLVATAFAFSFRWVPWRGLWVPEPSLYSPLAAQVFRRAADHAVPAGVQLVVTRPLDAFMAELWVAVGLGVALALPAVLGQLGGFFAPALAARERRILWRALAPVVALFLLGAAFAYAWVLPATLRALYGYAGPLGAVPLLGVGDFAAFAFGLLVAFGVAFQLPLVLYVLARVGILHWRSGVRYWRHTVVAILFVSASLTPDASPVTLALLAGPLAILYAAGLGLAWWGGRRLEASSAAR